MNPFLEEIYATNQISTPEGGSASIAGESIDIDEAELLSKLVRELQPTVTLEVGLAFGVSALAICDAHPKTTSNRHIVIDPYQNDQPRWAGIGLHNLRKAGFESLIEFHETHSYRALPQIEATGQVVEVAFIDGWHTFDFVLVDFFYIDKMLCEGGIVIFDDADWPSIRRVIRYVVSNLHYSVYKTLPPHLITKSNKRRVYEAFINLGSSVLKGVGRIPGLKKPIARGFGGELLGIDRKYGLDGSFIALRKEKEKKRMSDHHIDF